MSAADPSTLTLYLHSGQYAICRLAPDAALPPWASPPGFCSITRTADELSIVCAEGAVPAGVKAERQRRLFQVEGPLDFALVGVLARLATTMATAGLGIFTVSTFDTDYLLVRDADVPQAIAALSAAGYAVRQASGCTPITGAR